MISIRGVRVLKSINFVLNKMIIPENIFENDKFKDECGLVGVWNVPEAANLAYLGLYAQQHRGQEGAGVISVTEDKKFHIHRGLGLVSEVFNDYDFDKLPGKKAIGHVRYTTAGGSVLANVQPFCSEISIGRTAVAHNGNLVNADTLRKALIANGSIFSSTSDTEIVLHLLACSNKNKTIAENLIDVVQQIQGAYSLLIFLEDRLFALRDPNGFRPLCIGKLGDGLVVASETCALDLIGADYVRDVEPGEIVEITGTDKTKSYFPFGKRQQTPCVFEYIYFARPDSRIFGKNVYEIRKRFGAELAKAAPVEADVVIPVPDSGVPAALGFSQATGIPFEYGLIRNHYVGRTFIEPTQSIRDFGVKIKHNPNVGALAGKRVVVVDDSIVRGTTSRKLIRMIRSAGATEVHLRISAPPTISPCFYGIDTPKKEELIAATHTIEEIKKYLEVDSLTYLTVEAVFRAVQSEMGTFCDACFTGNYPVAIIDQQELAQEKLFKIMSKK